LHWSWNSCRRPEILEAGAAARAGDGVRRPGPSGDGRLRAVPGPPDSERQEGVSLPYTDEMGDPLPDETQVQELLQRARGRDPDAFEKLAEPHRGALGAFVRSRRGRAVKLGLETEDIVQETFLQAYRSLDRFHWRGPDSLRRWLCGIAEHLIRNVSRNRGLKVRQLFVDPPNDDPSPSRRMRQGERFERLREALRSLGPERRQVVELARIRGLKIQEIADRMGRSPGAVRQLLWRALAEIKTRFGDTVSLSLPARSLEGESGEHRGEGGHGRGE
jgi:RNA polymerase sigma-70 factor (ECF subfamily)